MKLNEKVALLKQKKKKQVNRGDMRKIPVTRQFFAASSRHGDFFEKTKKTFLDKVNGSMCTKFQVCFVFRLARRFRSDKPTSQQTNPHIYE